MHPRHLIPSRFTFVLALLLFGCAAHGQTACPWLTEGTASALLNGPVTVTTNILPSGEGTCTFTLHQSAIPSALEITVSSTNHPACPANSKSLAGIGNEAVTCSPTETTGIIGSRVRNLYFTVRLTLTGKSATSPTQRQSILQQATEEVAGTLF